MVNDVLFAWLPYFLGWKWQTWMVPGWSTWIILDPHSLGLVTLRTCTFHQGISSDQLCQVFFFYDHTPRKKTMQVNGYSNRPYPSISTNTLTGLRWQPCGWTEFSNLHHHTTITSKTPNCASHVEGSSTQALHLAWFWFLKCSRGHLGRCDLAPMEHNYGNPNCAS